MGDLALLRLTEPVPERFVPLRIAPRNSIRVGPGISMIGSPYGLPLKAVVGGDEPDQWPVISSIDDWSFQTNLDAFQRNSGSPVLDDQGRVIGLLSELRKYTEFDANGLGVFPNLPGESWCSRIDLLADLFAHLRIDSG